MKTQRKAAARRFGREFALAALVMLALMAGVVALWHAAFGDLPFAAAGAALAVGAGSLARWLGRRVWPK